MASQLGAAGAGAIAGAGTGAALGPWGAAGGAIIGGIGGWLSGGNNKSPEELAAEQQRANATQLAGQAASGQGPSAAQALLSRGLGQENNLAMSQAKSTAGANPALAAVMASNAAASNSQAAVNQSAALRAQEMNDARAQYLQATGADVEHATQMSNANIAYNNSMYNGLMSGLSGAAGKIAAAGKTVPGAAAPGAPAAPAMTGADGSAALMPAWPQQQQQPINWSQYHGQ